MTLRLHQLRALVGVVEHGGIRAASRQLHISQAALTKSLRQLEEDAGVPLLVRSPRGVSLTEAGQRLLTRASLVTRQLDLATVELRQASGDQAGQVSVALTPYVTLQHLGQAFLWFRQRYPKVALELAEGLVSRVLPRLRDGSLDLAVVADTGDLPIGEFQTRQVLAAEQHIVVRSDHPVLARPTPQALAELEWVLTGPRDGLKSSRLKAIFARAGVTPPQQILFCDALAGMSLLRNCDVAGIVPAPLLDQPEGRGLVAIAVPELDLGALQLVLLTRPDVPLTPAAEYFAQCLIDASLRPPAE
ncbi:MAG: LysR substrate-binding domain-containing protein [Burkholderiaceae bacterium]